MKISGETISSASSSRFARLSVNKDQENQEVVVCKKSFFSWAVHAMRYRFSSNYREKEHALRTSILGGLREQGSNTAATLNDPGDAPGDDLFGNRREFNAYLIKCLNRNSDPAENSTTVLQGEIRVAEDGATPVNSQVQPASAVKAKKIASSKQKWPGAEGVESFWNEQGPAIAKDGYKNAFQFGFNKCLVENEELLCTKVFGEIAKNLRMQGIVVPNRVNCVLACVLFTKPEGTQMGLFTDSGYIDQKDLTAWGFSVDITKIYTTRCRLPNERLYGAVNGLLDRHFKAGQSKEKILKGLRQDRNKARNVVFRSSFQDTSRGPPSVLLTEEEFRFCLDAMENFANAYFDANS